MPEESVSAAPLPTLCAFCPPEADGTIELKQCIKCSKSFCPIHSSKISPNACQTCFSEFAVVVDKYTREDVEYNEKTDTVTTHKSSSRRIRLDGPDYVWYSIAIQRLTDDELASMFQFHRFMVSLLEHTTTVRLVRKTQAHAGEKSTRNILTSTTTEVKKTRKVKTQKTLREVLMASGIVEPQLSAMLAAAGVTP